MNAKNYKVLVADDEYWIRENLRTMLDWQEYSLSFMEPAVDGEDAWAKVNACCPDILITDINMPFINGIELVRRVKDLCPHVVIIILSGYSDFEYVRDALLAGAIDYILKPLARMNLVDVLAKAMEVIGRNRLLEREKESIREELIKASSLLRDRELSMLIANEEYLAAGDSVSYQISDMDMDFTAFSLVLIKIGSMKKLLLNMPNSNMGLLSYSIKAKIGETVREGKSIIFNNTHVSNEFIMISDLDKTRLDRICDKLLEMLGEFSGSSVNIAVSNHYFSFNKLHTAYNEALSAIMSRPYRHGSFKASACDAKILPGKKRINAEFENKLVSAIQNKNRALVKHLILEQTCLRNCERDNWLFIEVRQTVDRISGLLINTAAGEKSPLEIITLENLADLLDRVMESFDIGEVCSILEQMIDETIGASEAYGSNDTIRHTVKQVTEYINENYSEEMSLTSLSKKFMAESSYLSRAFKRETGENLMLYIARKRIGKAEELIRQGELNLTDISFLVGYDDYTYFNRVFHKVTGKSPREYKSDQTGIQSEIKESIMI